MTRKLKKSSRKSSTRHLTSFIFLSLIIIIMLGIIFSSVLVNNSTFSFFGRAASRNLGPINIWGNAAQFDGQTNYIISPETGDLNSKLGFTVEVWAKPDLPPFDDQWHNQEFVGKMAQNTHSYKLSMNILAQSYNNTYLVYHSFVTWNAANNCVASSPTRDIYRYYTSEELDQWQHVAGVIQDDGLVDIFLNGQRGTSPNEYSDGGCQISTPIEIGAHVVNGTGYTKYKGTLDEVRISDIARYQKDFTPSFTPFTPDDNTLLLYHLDEQNGVTTIQDSSTKGYVGNINGNLQFLQSTVPNPFANSEKTDNK